MVAIDEVDWALVDALQTNPRATWVRLGAVLGIDPATASRRWQRLSEEGLAWVSAYPGRGSGHILSAAIIEIECAPGTADGVAAAAAEDPHALNVDRTSGGRDIMIVAAAKGIDGLSRYLTGSLETIPGVVSARSAVVTQLMTEGSSWRSDALDETQRKQLTPRPDAQSARAFTDVDFKLISALALDGRMSVKGLATHTGLSESTVRRNLPELIANGGVRLRTDISRVLSDRPFGAVFFIQAAAGSLSEVHARISALPGVRSCTAVAGPSNLIVGVWLKAVREMQEFEMMLGQQGLPLEVHDRSMILRVVKHNGRILSEDGRAQRHIPLRFGTTA